jgi:tRNA threonylcarbamoyladenosine biosynthesis protein TsaE
MEKYDITQLGDLENFVGIFLDRLRKFGKDRSVVVALHGDLGFGKTATVQLIAKKLGVSESVVSPTFTIMKKYATVDPVIRVLYHLDVYRFESPLELIPLQFTDLLKEAGALICIEWAEKIITELPGDTIHLYLDLEDTGVRTARLEAGNLI